jgi:hypothetical protein
MNASANENQWVLNAMEKMTENKGVSQKKAASYLDALLSAADPETGEKLSRRETVRMAAAFMYVNDLIF